jgi:hypothetical protein
VRVLTEIMDILRVKTMYVPNGRDFNPKRACPSGPKKITSKAEVSDSDGKEERM